MEKLCSFEMDEVFDRVALLPGEQLIAPHLERFPGTDRFKTLRLAFYQVASATLMVVVRRGGGGGDESGETERAGGRLRGHDVTVWTCWASAAG